MMKKNPKIPSIADTAVTRTMPLQEEVATQAYILWQHYGRPRGRDVSIWLEAERQILGADQEVNRQGRGTVDADRLDETLNAGVSLPQGEADRKENSA